MPAVHSPSVAVETVAFDTSDGVRLEGRLASRSPAGLAGAVAAFVAGG